MIRGLSIVALAALLAASPVLARGPSRSGNVSVPFVRHGEVQNLGPAEFPNGRADPRISEWLRAKEGTRQNDRARLCQVLPGALQAGCLDR